MNKLINNSYKKLAFALTFILALTIFVGIGSQKVFATYDSPVIKEVNIAGSSLTGITLFGDTNEIMFDNAFSQFQAGVKYDVEDIVMGATGGDDLHFTSQNGVSADGSNGYYNIGEVYISEEGKIKFTKAITGQYVNSWESILDIAEFVNGTTTLRLIPHIPESDLLRPAISGEENFATNVDDAKPISYFQSFLSAYDETDGDLTSSIYVITDNYTANKSVLGTHKVVWGVKDLSNNEATLEAYIRVVDVTAPVISGNTSKVKVGYKETYNIENFRKTLTVSDNYYTMTNADITLKTDGYTTNKTKLGTYTLVFEATDPSGNKTTFSKQVEVYDNVIPIFDGITTLVTSNNTILTESEVRAQITARDDIDGNLTTRIKLVEDNFTGKGNKVGTYTIKYSVTDNAGNIAYHTVTINRNDRIPPVIWIENGVSIKTNPTTPLTQMQIIEILQATGQVSTASTTNFRFTHDEYTDNEKIPGVYLMSIEARSTDGSESLHNMNITVLSDVDEDDAGINIDGVGNFFQKNKTALIIGGVVILSLLAYGIRKSKY